MIGECGEKGQGIHTLGCLSAGWQADRCCIMESHHSLLSGHVLQVSLYLFPKSLGVGQLSALASF